MLICAIVWTVLGFAGGIFCLITDKHWDEWLDGEGFFWGIVACVALGPLLLAMMIFLYNMGKKQQAYFDAHPIRL